jgi:hypothetical protein
MRRALLLLICAVCFSPFFERKERRLAVQQWIRTNRQSPSSLGFRAAMAGIGRTGALSPLGLFCVEILVRV